MNKIRHILTTIMLLAGITAMAQQEVVIRITRKTNPLPPDASSYIVKPSQYFNISITNPLDEPQDVYFGVKLHQMTTEGNSYAIQDIYTPDDKRPPAPNYVLHLLPSTTKVLTPLQINDLFSWYNSSEISGLDGVVNNLGGNAIGLLPEGHYRVTLSAFSYATGALVSNPDLSTCEFDIRYNADPPEFIQVADKPVTSFLKDDYSHRDGWRVEFEDLPVVSLDLVKKDNWFKWNRCTMGALNPVPSANYTLQIFHLNGLGALSLEQIGNTKSFLKAEWSKDNATELKMPALNDNTLYKYGHFYAIRVVAKPLVTDASTANYMVVKNKGASQWLIVYNTDDTNNGVNPGNEPGNGEDEPELTSDWRLQLSYPNIKVNGKDNENDGFKARYLTADNEGNLVVEWEKPAVFKANDADKDNAKLYEKLEFTYDVGIYQIPEENNRDLEEILKGEPLTINKDIKADKDGKLKTTLKYDDIAKKIKFYTNYIFVVTPKITKPETKEGEIVWTGSGNNCYTFAFLLTAAQNFAGCNEGDKFPEKDERTGMDLTKGRQWKEIPDEIKEDTKQDWELFVGNVDSEKAFKLRFLPGVKRKKALKDLKDGEASQFSGDCIVQWNPKVGGKTLYVNVLCVLTDAEFNLDGQMIAGTCKSKERTGCEWIPYNLINYAKMKAEATASPDFNMEVDMSNANWVEKWIIKKFGDAGDAIKGGLSKGMEYALKPESLKAVCGSYYDHIIGNAQGANDVFTLLDACFETDLKSQPVTLPMRFPPDLVKAIHTDISLMSMEFTPIGASMDALMLFNMPEGDKLEADTVFKYAFVPWLGEHPEYLKDDKGNPLTDDKLEEAKKKAEEDFRKEFDEIWVDHFGGKPGEENNYYDVSSGIAYSKVLSFTITDMCMEQGRLWSDTGTAALTFDMDIKDVKNNFYFTFKAPKDPSKINSLDSMDGCSFRWEKMGSEDFKFQLGLAGEIRIPELLTEDGKQQVNAGFGFITDDWSDFTVDLHMDSFRVPDAQDWLFHPGKILWDHSSKSNPAGLKFPVEFAGGKGYDWGKYFPGEDFSNVKFDEKTADVRWQGLYIEEISVEFPGSIEIDQTYDDRVYDEDVYEYDKDGNVVLDDDGEKKVAHKAGDSVKDEDGNVIKEESTSTSYTSKDRKFAIALTDMVFDRTGISLCGGLKNLFKVGTAKAGGWMLSIDKVSFNVIQNDFRGCGFDGKVRIPLLSDTISYKCDIAMQTKEYLDQTVHLYSKKTDNKVYGPKEKLAHLVFKTSTPKNTNFDFCLGNAWIDEKGSWLKIEHLPGHGTDVELMMSGVVTLGSANEDHKSGKVSQIPFSIPGVRFTGMRIANFSAAAEVEVADPKDSKNKVKSDYASQFAKQWADDHKEDVYSMAQNRLNALIKGSELSMEGGANDKAKESTLQAWSAHIAEAMKSRECDLSAPGHPMFFSMGDWSFASAEKSFFNWNFNIGGWKFGMDKKDKDGNDLGDKEVILKFGFTGTVGLLQKAATKTTTINADGTSSTTKDVAADQSQKASNTMAENADGSKTITENTGSNELSATVGLTLRSKVKYDFNDFSNCSLGFDGVDVDSVKVDGSFGGGMVGIKGKLVFKDTSEQKGFQGSLEMSIMGITAGVAGAVYDMKKTEEEKAASSNEQRPVYSDEDPNLIDHWEVVDTYKSIYFVASFDGGDKGIPIVGTGVTITALMGGFYYNYTVPDIDANEYDKMIEKLKEAPEPKFRAYGFAAGLGLKWGEAAAAINGKFCVLVGYDADQGMLGTFKMLGDVRGLKDTLKATACIQYTQKGMKKPNDPEREQHFSVSVTLDVSADLTDQLTEFVGGKDKLESIKKTFDGGEHKTGLSDMTNGEQDTKKEKDDPKDEQDNKEGKGTKGEADESKAKDNAAAKEAGTGFQANMSAHLSLLVDIKSRPNDPDPNEKGTKWMVCIGEPELSKRCSVTLLDVQVGKGDWRIWAKVYANAYLCFGNKLPGNGDLPELPEALQKFLDDGKVAEGDGGSSVSKESGKLAELNAQREEAIQKMIAGGAGTGKANNGGVMFGMQAGSDFGCRFGIGYTELGGLVGFDLSLRLMKECEMCLDEKGRLRRMGGKGGTYSEGQVYAYAYGRAGLILNLGFWSGDVDLLDLKLGAVLKGGFPNPTWAYGKLKAKGSLFGGLIKFNKKVEMKMGQVCMPLVGNPLDNIDIISESSIGLDNESEGWSAENAVSPTAPFTFVTNMGIGQVLEVFDEDLYNAKGGMDTSQGKSQAAQKGATRLFKFYVRPYAETKDGKQWVVQQTTDNSNFEVCTGVFEPNKKYKVTLHGWCKELFPKTNSNKNTTEYVEEDPFIRDMKLGKTVQQPWGQDYVAYFCTSNYTDDMAEAARLVGPYDEESSMYDLKHPYVALATPLPQFDEDGVEIFADLEEVIIDPITKQKHLILPDQLYSDDGNYTRLSTTPSKYQGIRMRQVIEEGIDQDGNPYKYITVVPVNQGAIDELEVEPGTYTWTFYEMNTKGLNKLRGGIEETYERMNSGDAQALADLLANEEVQEWLQQSGNDSMVADMIKEYQSGGEFNTSEMENRVNTISDDAYNRGSTFRTEILSFSTHCAPDLKGQMGTGGKTIYTGYAQTFREQMQNDMRTTATYERSLYSLKHPDKKPFVLTGGGIHFKPLGMKFDNPNTLDIYHNPYHRLWWWNWKVMYPIKNNNWGNPMSGEKRPNNCDAFETGERLKLHMEHGYRQRMSSRDNENGYDAPWSEEDAKTTFQEFTDMYNPFGDNRWHHPTKSGLKYELSYVRHVYDDDITLVWMLDEDIIGVFNEFVLHPYTGQDEYDYAVKKVDGKMMRSLYRQYLEEGNKKRPEKDIINEDDRGTYLGTTLDHVVGRTFSFKSYVAYPAWQVGAMFMNSRYYMAPNSSGATTSEGKKYANNKNLWTKQFLRPYSFIKDEYTSYSEVPSQELYDNISGARRFEGGANATLECLVLRPNRYNVLASEYKDNDSIKVISTIHEGYLPYGYHVSKSEQGDRILTIRQNVDGTMTVSAVFENIGNGSVYFSDPVVEKVIKKELGKDENAFVTYAELQNVKNFNHDTYNEVKSLDDLGMLKNLETFSWHSTSSIPSVSFEANPKLREIVITHCGRDIGIDFSTCPNLERLVVTKSIGSMYSTSSYNGNMLSWKTYDNAMRFAHKPNLRDMPALKRLQINYTLLDEIDLSNVPNLEYLNVQYNRIGDNRMRKTMYIMEYGRELRINDVTKAPDPEPYVFDLTMLPKLQYDQAMVGYQMTQDTGNGLAMLDPDYLAYTASTIDFDQYWRTDWTGRKVVAIVNDATMFRSMSPGGVRHVKSVEVRMAGEGTDGTNVQLTARENLNGLDDNLRKVIFRDFGKAKVDKNGTPATTTHLPNEVEYWTDLFELDLNKLKLEKTLDASGCNVQTIDNLALYMPGIETLNLSSNLLTEADLRPFKKLKDVDLSENRLANVRLGGQNATITRLDISNNGLRDFDFSQIPNVVELNCSNNALYLVDLTPLTKVKTLDISHNNVNNLDIRQCRVLVDFDCSYNPMRSAPTQLGFTLLADESANTALTTLRCVSVTDEAVAMCQTQKFPALTELDLSDNAGLQSLTISTKLKKLDVHNTVVDKIFYTAPNSNTLLLKGSPYGESITYFDAHNSCFGRSYPSKTLSISRKMNYIDVSDCEFDAVSLQMYIDELYVGAAVRDSKRIAVACSNDNVLADWDLNKKNLPKNANTYAYKGIVGAASVQEALNSDFVDADMLRLRAALGDKLYDHIKNDSTLSAIPEGVIMSTRVIDARPYNYRVSDFKFIVDKFPKLEELYLRQDKIEGDKFQVSRGLNKLEVVNPGTSATEESVFPYLNKPIDPKGSLLRVNGYTLMDFGGLSLLMDFFETADFSDCHFIDAATAQVFIKNETLKYFTADNTNIRSMELKQGCKIKKLSFKGCSDLEEIHFGYRSLITSGLRPDSLMLDGCGPEMTVIFEDEVDAKTWVNEYAPKYPDIKFKMILTVLTKDYISVQVPLPQLDAKYSSRVIETALNKAKELYGQYYKPSIPSEAEQAFVRKILPTDESYMNTWKLIGHYPEGLHKTEVRDCYALDLSGAHHTDGRITRANSMYRLENLIATNSAFDCKTFYVCGNETNIDLTNNPMLEDIDTSNGYKCTMINVSRTAMGGDVIGKLVQKTDTVYANGIVADETLEINVPADAWCQVLELDGNRISTLTLDKKMDKISVTNVSGDGLVIYLNAVPCVYSQNFVIDNSANITVRSKRYDVITSWFSTYAKLYPNVKFEMGLSNTYIPVSSKSDADYKSLCYGSLYKAFPDGWADLEVIDLRGDVLFGNKSIDQLLEDAKQAWKLISGNNINEKHPAFSSPKDSKLRVLDLRGYDRLESLYFWNALAEGSEIILDGNTNLVNTNNVFHLIETVSANGCSSISGTITVGAEDMANNIDLGGTKVSCIELDKHIASLKADKMMCDTLGVRFTGCLDDVTLELDKAKLTSVILDREGAQGWFDKHAAKYPYTKVYVRYNGKDIPLASMAEYEDKVLGVVGKYLRVVNRNMPEVDESNLDEVTELNIRGAGADDEFFQFMATYMPNVHTIIADAPGSLKANEDGRVNIPVTETPIKEFRADGITGVGSIMFGSWGGDSNAEDDAVISISGSDFEDINDGIKYTFRKVIARNCPNLTGASVMWDSKVSDLDVSGSAVTDVRIEKEIDRLVLRDLASSAVSIYTDWLPDNPADFDVSGNSDVTIEIWRSELIEKWFAVFAPVYPGVKISVETGGDPIIITSADEYRLMPIFERNPDVNMENLAKQTSINLNNCPEVNEMLSIVYEKCKNLKKITLAYNYSWMPTFTYDHNITVDFGNLETPKTLIVATSPKSGKILLGNDEKLTVRFADFGVARSWYGNRYATKYPNVKYVVDVNGTEIVTRDINLVLYLMTPGNDAATLTTLDVKGYSVEPEVMTNLIEILPEVVSINAPSNSINGTELTLPAIPRKYKKVDLSGNSSLTTLNWEGVAEPQVSSLDLTGTQVANIGPLARDFYTVTTDLGGALSSAIKVIGGEVKLSTLSDVDDWFNFVTDVNGVTTYMLIDGNYVMVTSTADARSKLHRDNPTSPSTTQSGNTSSGTRVSFDAGRVYNNKTFKP